MVANILLGVIFILQGRDNAFVTPRKYLEISEEKIIHKLGMVGHNKTIPMEEVRGITLKKFHLILEGERKRKLRIGRLPLESQLKLKHYLEELQKNTQIDIKLD